MGIWKVENGISMAIVSVSGLGKNLLVSVLQEEIPHKILSSRNR
jgi:hypothetical protein